MEQGQLHRPDSDNQQVEEPIKYGDVFDVKGDLADQKVAPRDAAVMQSAENKAFGYIHKGGPASVMQSAANKNEKAGFVGHSDVSDVAAAKGVAISETNLPVDYSDAAAIQAAEVRATGRTNIIPGGVAAAAQSAATRNARATRDEDKTKLAEVLAEASSKLPSDKPVTRRDAEGVIGAELRNDPNLCTRPGGVAASVAAAARLNQSCLAHAKQHQQQGN